MNLVFEEAEPTNDNPWQEGVDRIAGKTGENGKPLALKTAIDVPDQNDEEAVKAYEKLLRDAHKAGREHNPPVTVRKDVSAVKTRTEGRGANTREVPYVEVTIWTVPQQTRQRKSAQVPATDPADVPATDPAIEAEFSHA